MSLSKGIRQTKKSVALLLGVTARVLQRFADRIERQDCSSIAGDVCNADGAVRSAESQVLELLMKHIPYRVFWKDREGRYKGCNYRFAQSAGSKEPASLVGLNDLDLPWERAEALAYMEDDAKVMSTGHSKIDFDEMQADSSGRLSSTRTSKIPLRSDDGEIVGVFGISFDNTDRVNLEQGVVNAKEEAEAAARELADFRVALDSANDCVFMFDAKSLLFVYVNQGAIEQVGYTAQELSEMTPVDIKPHYDDVTFREMVKPLYDSPGLPARFRTVHEHRDGHHVPVEISLKLIPELGPNGRFVAIVRDISDQLEDERKLTQAKEHAERVVEEQKDLLVALDSANESVLISDAETNRFVYVNKKAHETLGYTAEEMSGFSPLDINHWNKERLDSELMPLMAEGLEFVKFRTQHIHKNGYKIPVEVKVQYLSDGAGSGRYFAIARDISQELEDERRLIEAKESLEKKVIELEEAQEEIAEAGARLERAAAGTSDGLWDYVKATDTMWWSDQFMKLCGLEPDEFASFGTNVESYFELVHPEDRDRLAQAVESTLDVGNPYDIEYRQFVRKVGYRWFHARGAAITDDSGAVTRMSGSFRDIHERRTMQDELEEVHTRFERAINATSDGIWDYVPSTGEVWWSDQFKKLIGYTSEECQGMEPTLELFFELLHPHDREKVAHALQEHVENDTKYDIEYRLMVKDVGYRWFRARGASFRDETGQVICTSGSVSDIDELRTAQSRLDLATRVSRVGLWDWDVETGSAYFNDTFFTMLGYEAGEFPMRLETWANLLHPDDIEETMAAVSRHHTGETPSYTKEFRMLTKSGQWLWTRGVGELVERLEDGTPKRMVGAVLDVQDMRDALDAANEANHAKSAFLANMSHEIRTPMTAILGYADLLSNDTEVGRDRERAIEAARTIHTNGSHLLSLINDILDISKIEAGQVSVENIKVNPLEVVSDVIRIVRTSAEDKGLAFEVVAETELPSNVHTDPTRLRQILLNILGNSVKFTSEGAIKLAVSCDAETEQMRFVVTDTGIGMNAEQLESIRRFEPFNQADASMTRRYGGTGLGLYISNQLATMLGGEIMVDSVEGQGSAFTVTIQPSPISGFGDCKPGPIQPAERRQQTDSGTEKNRPAIDKKLEGARILLVEDGQDNQKLISFFLRKAGADVRIAENGEEALEIIDLAGGSSGIDIILMDMHMPVMDGYDATREIRRRGMKLPVIALTAHAMDGDRQRCLDAGCDGYETKPVQRERLIQVCVQWICADGERRAA